MSQAIQRTTRKLFFCLSYLLCVSAWGSSIDEEALIDAGMAHRPRTVPELISMLTQSKPALGSVEKLQASAIEEPKQNLQGDDLGDFYFRRAQSQVALGDPLNAIKDLSKAIDAFGPEVRRKRMLAQSQVIRMLDLSGRIEESNRELNVVASEWSELPWVMAKQVSGLSNRGEFIQAHQLQSELRKACIWKQDTHPFWCALMSLHIEQAAGHLSKKERKATDALAHYRKSLHHAHNALRLFPTIAQSEAPPPIEVLKITIDIRRLELARHLAEIGRYVEAEWQTTEVLTAQLNRSGARGSDVSDAAIFLAELLSARGKYDEAYAIASEAISYEQRNGRKNNAQFERKKNELDIARLINQSRAIDAAKLVRKMAQGENQFELINCNCIWSEYSIIALLKVADYSLAKTLARASVRKIEQDVAPDTFILSRFQSYEALAEANLDLPLTTARSLANSKSFAVLKNQVSMAKRQIALNRFGRSDASDVGKLIAYIAESHMNLLWKKNKSTAAFEALKLAELAKLATSPSFHLRNLNRLANYDTLTAGLIQTEQNLLERIRSLEQIALRLQSDATAMNIAQVSSVWTKVAELDNERDTLLETIRTTQPEYTTRMAEDIDSDQAIRTALQKGEALIATHVTDQVTHVWTLTQSAPIQWHASRITRVELTNKISNITKGLEPNLWLSEKPPPFDVLQASKLFEILFAQSFKKLTDIRKIVFVPDGPISTLPLNALVVPHANHLRQWSLMSDVNWLIKRYAITTLQSAATFTKMRELASLPKVGHNVAFLGIGDPVFSNNTKKEASLATTTTPVYRKANRLRNVVDGSAANLSPLPETSEELQSLANALGVDISESLLLQENATKAQVLSRLLAQPKIIAFATHGLNPNDLPGLFEPALALTTVEGRPGMGVLKASEIARLNLTADWVILSACNTADQSSGGTDVINSMANAFMHSGAKALLVTNWSVESSAARDLMISTFKAYKQSAGLSKSTSLQKAMITMIADPKRSHPFYWAPFSLISD
jgi:CHAT domain-containing protein